MNKLNFISIDSILSLVLIKCKQQNFAYFLNDNKVFVKNIPRFQEVVD